MTKKQLGLDDDTYRAVLERTVGKRSAKDCTDRQLEKALEAFKKAGFKGVSPSRMVPRYASSKSMSLIRAWWIALHKAGTVNDPSEAALATYVRRVTGQEMGKLDPKLAAKAIQGLKNWAKRTGVWKWPYGRFPALRAMWVVGIPNWAPAIIGRACSVSLPTMRPVSGGHWTCWNVNWRRSVRSPLGGDDDRHPPNRRPPSALCRSRAFPSPPAVGTGYVLRSAAEIYLVGRVGQPRYRARNVRNLIVAPIREHSRKPDQMHRDIEALVAGPYLELFARQPRHGWDCWGNETDKFAEEATHG